MTKELKRLYGELKHANTPDARNTIQERIAKLENRSIEEDT